MKPLVAPDAPPRLLGVRNFRDIGGLGTTDGRRIRHGVVFRSGHFGAATPEDLRVLQNLDLERIDLRTSAEIALEDEPGGARPASVGVEYASIDDAMWLAVRTGDLDRIDPALTAVGSEQAMLRLYRGSIAHNVGLYRSWFDRLSRATTPVVVHCSAGKDRTGWAIATLLTVLGVADDQIMADYTASSDPDRQYVIRDRAGNPVTPTVAQAAVIAPLNEARPHYLNAAWAEVATHWGGHETYLGVALGLDAARAHALRERLLY